VAVLQVRLFLRRPASGQRRRHPCPGRFVGDLERLCTAHAVAPKVAHTPGNDYPYRMDFSRALWARIVQAEAEAIDYDNFKDSVHGMRSRDIAYMSCWAALRHAFDRRTRRRGQ